MRVATAAPDGLHTHEDAEVLIDFGDAGVLSGRRDSPQSRPPSAAAPSRWSWVHRLESPITLHHTYYSPFLSLCKGTAGRAFGDNLPAGRSAAPTMGATAASAHCGSHTRTSSVRALLRVGVGLTRPHASMRNGRAVLLTPPNLR